MLKKTMLFGLVLLYSSSNVFADWKYSNVTDQMTDESVYIATTSSLNTLNFGFPYSGVQKGILTLRVHPRHGLDMIISIERGQILCQSYQDCSVTMRLGSSKPKNQKAVGSADNSRNIIFLRNPEYILPNLSSSKKLLLELPVYQEGNVLLEFKTENLDVNKIGGFGQSSVPSNKNPQENHTPLTNEKFEETVKVYSMQIGQRIKRYWIKPSSIPAGLSAKIKLTLLSSGDVASVSVVESSGNNLFDRSLENAVYRAAPMPLPSNPDMAKEFKEIEVSFSDD